MNKKYHTTSLIIIVTVWMIISILCWISPTKDASTSERRPLKQKPTFQLESSLNGTFMENFESASLDQFPFRDLMRTIKAVTSLYGFQQLDNNGISIQNGIASQIEYPLNQSSYEYALSRFSYLYETYLQNNKDIYVSIVPDKNYFTSQNSLIPTYDYQYVFNLIEEGMDYAKMIDIANLLSIDDYYKTDTHWKQESLQPIALEIAKQMNVSLNTEFKKIDLDVPFYGVYYGQSALPLKPDSISYLTNEIIDSCIVRNYETSETLGIYNQAKLNSIDPYEFYLSGASPIITIDNPLSTNNKELIVFRDSFASSLIPLLVEGYSRITLIDIRYISSEYLDEFITKESADVLFLYSTLILNSSAVLK